MALPLIYQLSSLDIFVLARIRLSQLAMAASSSTAAAAVIYCCMSPVSGLSGGSTRLRGVCLLLVAAASCLLHGRQMLPPSSCEALLLQALPCCIGGRISQLCDHVIIQSAYEFVHNLDCDWST